MSGEIKLRGQTPEGSYFICSFLLLRFLPVTSHALSRSIYFLQITNKIFHINSIRQATSNGVRVEILSNDT